MVNTLYDSFVVYAHDAIFLKFCKFLYEIRSLVRFPVFFRLIFL